MPLSLRDLIWLKVCRDLNTKYELEIEEAKLDFQIRQHKTLRLLLEDIKQIQFWKLGYTEEEKAKAEKAWCSLPSAEAAGIKPHPLRVGMTRSKPRQKDQNKIEAGK